MQFASQAEALHWNMEHADDEMGAARGLRAWSDQVRREGGRTVADTYLVAAVSSPALYAWRARAYWRQCSGDESGLSHAPRRCRLVRR